MAARFEMYKDPAEAWRWRLQDAKGVTIAEGAHSFDSSEQCRREIQAVRQSAFRAELDEPRPTAPPGGASSRRPGRQRPEPHASDAPKDRKNPFNAAA